MAASSEAAEPSAAAHDATSAPSVIAAEAADNQDLEQAALEFMEAVLGKTGGRAFMSDEPTEETEAERAESELRAAMAFLEDVWTMEQEVRMRQPLSRRLSCPS